MELLLIRHALPVRRELVVGVADPELSPAGHAQVGHLAEYLAAERLDAVYCSPLRRAVETGAPVAARQGIEPIVVDEVAEWDRMSPAYVPVEELRAADDQRWRDLIDGVWASDEDPDRFRARVLAAIEDLVDAHPGGRIAVVPRRGDQHLPRRGSGSRSGATRLLLPQLHVDPPRDGGRNRAALDPHDQRDIAPARHRAADRPAPNWLR